MKLTGYGLYELDGTMMHASRAAWLLTHGPIQDGLHVCHRCDNRRCVRPDHLFLGTSRDNMRDAKGKGRIGVLRPLAVGAVRPKRLSADDRRTILARFESGETNRALAKAYGVTHPAIVYARRWATSNPVAR